MSKDDEVIKEQVSEEDIVSSPAQDSFMTNSSASFESIEELAKSGKKVLDNRNASVGANPFKNTFAQALSRKLTR